MLSLLSVCFSVSVGYNIPIYDIPQLLEICSASVAVVDVVGVFPYVEGQQRHEAVFKRILRIVALQDEKLAVVVARKPYPA